MIFTYFIFNDTATTEIYTLSLHDALPIYDHAKQIRASREFFLPRAVADFVDRHRRLDAESFSQTAHERGAGRGYRFSVRSEEHTSELQSRLHLVCRLLLEKKKTDLNDTSM